MYCRSPRKERFRLTREVRPPGSQTALPPLEIRAPYRGCPSRNRGSLNVDHPLLDVDQIADSLARQSDQAIQLRVIEGAVLGGRLHFNELAGASHDNVHIDVGP